MEEIITFCSKTVHTWFFSWLPVDCGLTPKLPRQTCCYCTGKQGGNRHFPHCPMRHCPRDIAPSCEEEDTDSSILNPHHPFSSWCIPHTSLSRPMVPQHPEHHQGGCWPAAIQLLEVDEPQQVKQFWYFLKIYSNVMLNYQPNLEDRRKIQSPLRKRFCVCVACAYWLGLVPKQILNERTIV